MTEEAIDMQYMLRSLGVSVKGPTVLCGENVGIIISITKLNFELKKVCVYFIPQVAGECGGRDCQPH